MFPAEEIPEANVPPGSCRVMNVRNGMRYDFSSPADALAWIKEAPGAPEPLPMAKPTAEELAKWEALEREIDAEYGSDGNPLADL